MKVVIFCGGQGLRMREASEAVPKPMIPIGNRPILWHVMKYYAHYGFTDFVLCLGYKAEVIKDFFLTYDEALANDFVLSEGGAKRPPAEDRHPQLEHHVRRHRPARERSASACARCAICSGDDEMFLANYGDTLTDAAPADDDRACQVGRRRRPASSRSHPNYSFHVVVDGRRRARRASISDVTRSDIWINGGYFVMRSELLDDMRPGEDLVEEPFQRLMPTGKVLAQRHDGFWAPMDTLKDKQWLEGLHESGQAPWQLWNTAAAEQRRRAGRLRLMLPLLMGAPEARAGQVLALGAHPDDVEIGCGGTLLKLIEQGRRRRDLLGGAQRRDACAPRGARRARRRCSSGVPKKRVIVRGFRDGFFPYDGRRDQGLLRGDQGRVLARRRLHPSAQRPAPGPPARSAT